MPDYRIVLARSAERDMEALTDAVQERAERAIDTLRENTRPRGVQKLRGPADLWRIRVGDYRGIYRIDDKQRLVDISHVRHRRDAYE